MKNKNNALILETKICNNLKSLENKYAGMAPSDFHKLMHSDGRGCVNQQLATHSQLFSQRLSFDLF